MIITFKHELDDIENPMIFEDCYEPELQLSLKEKIHLFEECNPIVTYMFVDGKLVGETYGAEFQVVNQFEKEDDEDIEDYSELLKDAVYCYSTTILPEYRGRGLGRLLKAYWIGYVMRDYDEYGRKHIPIVGHSTSETMKKLNESLGAIHLTKHENWFGTKRTAYFYTLGGK